MVILEGARSARLQVYELDMRYEVKIMYKQVFVRWGAALVLVIGGIGIGRFALNTGAATTPLLNHGHSFTLTSAEQQVASTASAVSQSVVQVENTGVGVGSGVIATSNGYIVTNNHVVSGGSQFYVTLSNQQRYTARLVGTDAADDLAVLKINATGLQAARFGDSARLLIGQDVLAIGNPLGLGETVTLGIVSALNRTVSEGQNSGYLPNALQTSAPINPGNSGGALVSLDGQIVGVPTLIASDPQIGGAAQGIGFAIPSNQVVKIVNQIILDGHVSHTGRPYMGIGLVDNATATTSVFGANSSLQGIPGVQGALVTQVGNGTPAQHAGLQAGDVIVTLNAHAVIGRDSLFGILANLQIAQRIPMTVARQNQNGAVTHVHLTITLGELPA